MSPARDPRAGDLAGLGSARTARTVLRALGSRPGRTRAIPAMALTSAELIAPAAAHDRGVRDRWRGGIDASAARARFSDALLYARLSPPGPLAAQLFGLLEQIRVEMLGSRRYPGMAANLQHYLQEQWQRARLEPNLRIQGGGVETFSLLVRAALGAPLPREAQAQLGPDWRQRMSPRERAQTEALAGLLDDQRAFARQSLRLIAVALDLEPTAEAFDGGEPALADITQPQSGVLTVQREPVEGAPPRKGAVAEARAAQPPTPQRRAAVSALEAPYRVYTRAYDELVTPSQLFDAATLARRRHELDTLLERHLGGATRWAHRLQRALLAQQKRFWEFDQEEGLLDAARLTRIVARPLEPLIYKRERTLPFPGTIVSMLVDNSGSMRGESITTAALCVELLGRVLERCGVRTEVLGYTTRAWRGGRAFQQWCAEGRPASPGRLAELRHIVYKSAEQPWRRARTALGAMLEEGLLKDNVDGEALLWAHGRLLRRPESRRILVVICDGEPMEEATRQANDAEYLERHLRAAIRDIGREGGTQLVAIGIDHDVQRLYPRAAKVRSVEDLGEAIARQLLELLVPAPG